MSVKSFPDIHKTLDEWIERCDCSMGTEVNSSAYREIVQHRHNLVCLKEMLLTLGIRPPTPYENGITLIQARAQVISDYLAHVTKLDATAHVYELFSLLKALEGKYDS